MPGTGEASVYAVGWVGEPPVDDELTDEEAEAIADEVMSARPLGKRLQDCVED